MTDSPLPDSAWPPLFAHLAVHHPRPEHADDVLASMQRVAEAAAGAPGLLRIGPWRDARSGRLVGLSLWESEEAFRAAMPGIFAVVDHDPEGTWEQQPPDSFHLTPFPGRAAPCRRTRPGRRAPDAAAHASGGSVLTV